MHSQVKRFIFRVCWSSDFILNISTQLKIALLRDPIHRSFPVNPHLFLSPARFFNHTINLETSPYWLYPSVTAAVAQSISIDTPQLLGLVSVKASSMTREAAGQTGTEVHLSTILSNPQTLWSVYVTEKSL